jgi:hypothetical protein
MFEHIRKLLLPVGFLWAGSVAVVADERAPARTVRHDLVGVWRLVRIESRGERGVGLDRFYGDGNEGLMIYDDSGWFSVQIMGSRRPAVSVPEARPEQAEAALNALKAGVLDSYYAYYGTWRFDSATSTVIHHAHGALYPVEHDAVYAQHVEVRGNTMTFTRSESHDGVSTLQSKIWERAPPESRPGR